MATPVFSKLTQSISDDVKTEVQPLVDEAAASATTAYALSNYRATIDEAILDFPVGDHFTTTDISVNLLGGGTNTSGKIRVCRRTSVSPFYVHLGAASDPSSKVDVDAKAATADLASPDAGKGVDLMYGAKPMFALRNEANAARAAGYEDGTVVQIAGLEYIVDSTAAGAASATDDLGVDGLVPLLTVTPEHYGAMVSATDPGTDQKTANTAAWNAALARAATTGAALSSRGKYYLNGTIGPGNRIRWDANFTTLVADKDASYDEILHNPSGGSLTGSGVYCFLDMSGSAGTVVSGVLVLDTTASLSNMKAASRANLPASLCAISCCTASGTEWTFDYLYITKFGRGFYQGSFAGSAPAILPYTRMNGDVLYMRFIGIPFESGQSGNGFDDMAWRVMRVSRCAGRSVIRGTDVTAVSFFSIGLDKDLDIEDQTIAFTASSTTAVLSAPNTSVVVGSIIASTQGGLNRANGAVGFVAKVTAIAGDNVTLTLNVAPDTTVASANFAINPPTFYLSSGNFQAQHIYVEHVFDKGFELFSSKLVCADFKHSGGNLGLVFRYGAPISVLGDNCQVEITNNRNTENNSGAKSVVFVGSTRDGTAYNAATVVVKSGLPQEDWTSTYPIRVDQMWSDDISIIAGRVEASADRNPLLNLRTEYADRVAYTNPFRNGGEGYAQRSFGAAVHTSLGTMLTPPTASGGFAVVSGGTSVKSVGSTGQLYLGGLTITPGKRYRVLFRMSAYAAGAPTLRLYNNSSQVGSDICILSRMSARLSAAYFTATASSVNRVTIFGNTNDDYTVDYFTVEQVDD